ncbi:MAG: hypothetical protein V7L29_14725 [Nostoc sp.]|uniref:hypothetical protein n=1 Tax=Nostoc sp. TaxID=1180 RepID=UPI002FFB8812
MPSAPSKPALVNLCPYIYREQHLHNVSNRRAAAEVFDAPLGSRVSPLHCNFMLLGTDWIEWMASIVAIAL